MIGALPISGSSIRGHLDLRCELRDDGVPYISHQSFRAPIHIGKSYLDGDRLVLNIVNPTAGFFDGDQLETSVHVGRGSKFVLSTPSACRVYRTRSGTPAVSSQHFHVEKDGFLEWIPEPFIPHAGASYMQKTKINLHPRASLLYFDWLAPGRVAMGEIFAFQQLRWELDLTVGDKLVARERFCLQAEDSSLEALRVKFPAAHYLSIYAAGSFVESWPEDALDRFTNDDVYLGHGPVGEGVFVIRALARNSLAMRKLLESLRTLLYGSAGKKPPGLGRISL